MWRDNEMTEGENLMVVVIWSLLLYLLIGVLGGAALYAAFKNQTLSVLLVVVICSLVVPIALNALTKSSGYRLTECEPPVGTAQKLGFVLLSIVVPALFVIYMYSWVRRHFWRKRNCSLYQEIRKARKLLSNALKQPTATNSKLAVKEATDNYRYLLELISSKNDISLSHIKQAREQRELIELARSISDASVVEVNRIDLTLQT